MQNMVMSILDARERGAPRRTRRLPAMLVLVALACAALMAFAAAANADTTSTSSFTKQGVDAQNGSTATAGGAAGSTAAGDTINWVLSYRNTSGSTASVGINDPIAGNQSYVPGSLKAPPGWSATEPSAGSNAVAVSGSADVDGSTGAADLFSTPVQSFSAGASNGDGFEALFIGDRIYNIHHHRGPGSGLTLLDCHIKATGAECPGYPVDHVSPNAGDPFGTGPDVFDTSAFNNAAVDAAAGRIYVAVGVSGSTDIGVLCIDVTNSQSCGYTSLGATRFPNPSPGAAGNFSGGAQIGTKYYIMGGGDGAPVFCYDTTTQAACANWPTSGVPSAPGFVTTQVNFTASNTLVTYGGYLFTSFNNDDGSHGVGCIVVATGADCLGFPILRTTAAGIGGYAATAPLLDTSGNVTGLCQTTADQVGAALDTATAYQCWSLPGGTPLGAPPYDQMVPGAGVGHSGLNTPLQIGTRLYFAYISGTQGLGGASGPVTYTCWDSATSAPCAGFTPVSGGNDIRPYTLRQDPTNPDCVWELGDAGIFQVFSATFGGALGCNEGNATVQVSPSSFYCDSQSGHITGWRNLVLGGVTSADYDSVSVTITDADGNAVPGWTDRVFSSSQVPIDISSIPYGGSTTRLNVTVAINWGGHAARQASVLATFDGDAPQVCYSTKVGAAVCAAAQPINNDATAITTVAGGMGDAPGGNRSGTASFSEANDRSLCRADLQVRKSASPSPVTPGTNEKYTLAVKNNGPDTAENVRVSDTLPAGTTFVSASSGCTDAGDRVTCTLPSLANGASHDFAITVKLASSLAHSPKNTATVTSDTPDPDPSNNTDTVNPPLKPKDDLQISKVASSPTISVGGQVMYTIVVRNDGPSDATGVTVDDPMGNGLTLVSAKAAQGSCSIAGERVRCNVGTVVAGGSTQVLVTAKAPATAGQQVTNTVTVGGDQDDTNPRNNTSSAKITTVAQPPAPSDDLAVTKKANHARIVIGQRVTYTIVVTNNGPDAAPDAKLTDTLNAPAKVVSVKTTQGTCGKTLPLKCTFGTIAKGKKVTITVVAVPTTLGKHRNAASTTADGTDSNPSNNLAHADVTVTPVTLRLTKVANHTAVKAGQQFTYTIRVSNPTAGTARNVVTCDDLPSAIVFVSGSPKPKLTKGRYCWTVKQLGPHKSAAYRLTVKALKGASGRKVNHAVTTSPDARTTRATATVRIAAGAVKGGGVTG